MIRYDSYGFPELDLEDGEKLLTTADFALGGLGIRPRVPYGTLFLTELRLVWLSVKGGTFFLPLWRPEPIFIPLDDINRAYQKRLPARLWMRALLVELSGGRTLRFYPVHSSTDVVKWGRAITDLARMHRSLEDDLS